MIEAMACGTPVVAFRSGSVPEVLEDGISGFIARDVDEAVKAVGRLDELDRAKVRAAFERRFTSERMAKDYAALYRRLPGVRTDPRRPRREPALPVPVLDKSLDRVVPSAP